jgi:hypothetical protein
MQTAEPRCIKRSRSSRSGEVRGPAGRRLADWSETEESLRDGRRQSRALERRAARQHRQGWQRRRSAALCVGTGWIAVRPVPVGGVIHRHVHMVLARRHCTGRHGGHGCVGITQNECQMAIDRREHEAGRHQPAQEHEPENEQRSPAGFLNVAHLSSRC